MRDWLLLYRVPGIGSRSFLDILTHYSAPGDFLRAGPGAWQKLGLAQPVLQALARPDEAGADQDMDWAAQPNRHILTLHDARYPPLLRETASPPPLLFVHGKPALLAEPQLAVVGSRNPTPDGREAARVFARALAGAGLGITSGLAAGVDAASHEGALEGGGATVAVMGTGPDRIYPAANRGLAERIAAQGALVTEFPTGVRPAPENFPRRNRIIAGLALGALVVEAARQSGSLITARLASEAGREVFAIPGSIHNPLARGCHALIRQGAKLVEEARDILEELAPQLRAALQESATPAGVAGAPELGGNEARLYATLGFGPVAMDTLMLRSGLTAPEVSSILLALELKGLLRAMPGGLYQRTGQ